MRGRTPLIYAAAFGSVNIARTPRSNRTTEDGRTRTRTGGSELRFFLFGEVEFLLSKDEAGDHRYIYSLRFFCGLCQVILVTGKIDVLDMLLFHGPNHESMTIFRTDGEQFKLSFKSTGAQSRQLSARSM